MKSETLIKVGVAAVLYGNLLRKGIGRRRKVWDRRSWVYFTVLVLIAVVAATAGILMARGVDHGVYNGMNQLEHRLYFVTMFILALGGALGSAAAVLWLAMGRPDRQLGPHRGIEPRQHTA